MGQWFFETQPPGAPRRDPQEAELFKTEQAGQGEYAGNDHLVREVIQNAIDAWVRESPLRVRFSVLEAADSPPAARLAEYFERLKEALAKRSVDYDAQGVPKLTSKFLVCEDFQTRGLEGDVLRRSDPTVEPQQDFYWFWRNIGRSSKTGDDLGRWGLGKTVFRAASRVRCMFGLTVRSSDRKRLMMGQGVLQSHSRDGCEYIPEGYWCGEREEGLPLPIEDDVEVEQFCREWHITRTDEPGLSVIVPFVPEELKAERLLQAVAVHFFMRILRGELEVEVVGAGLSVKLDPAGIEAECERILWDGPKRMKRHVSPPIGFAKKCLKEPPTVETQLLGKPELNDDAFNVEELTRLRHQFASGDLTSLRVNLLLPRRNGREEEGQFDVYLQRHSDGKRYDSYFVREGMTITKINSRASQRGTQALVNVEAGPLAKLLGDTEGPAHEDWDTSQERPDRDWKTWKGRVTFVRKIVDNLVEILTPGTSEPDFDLLSDFFSIEKVEGPQRKCEPGKESEAKPKIEFPPFAPKWFHITERAGGFTVSREASVPLPENAALKVAVAYDLPRGDPLRNWNALDFRIGKGKKDLRPSGEGLNAKLLEGNKVYLTIAQDSFHFTVNGFDRHRDLFVRVDDVSNVEEANHD